MLGRVVAGGAHFYLILVPCALHLVSYFYIMLRSCAIVLSLTLLANCKTPAKNSVINSGSVPTELLGNFKDDYDENYTISESLWIHGPYAKYHLLKYDSKGNYFIAKNDDKNSSDAGMYSRIDITYFSNMEPWKWGFCLTAYKAKTFQEAEATAAADRNNPKKGCGGFPFSRMKRK